VSDLVGGDAHVERLADVRPHGALGQRANEIPSFTSRCSLAGSGPAASVTRARSSRARATSGNCRRTDR
jgi:hypothetical protein